MFGSVFVETDARFEPRFRDEVDSFGVFIFPDALARSVNTEDPGPLFCMILLVESFFRDGLLLEVDFGFFRRGFSSRSRSLTFCCW